MLDLEKLESKLDSTLEKETAKTLTDFILECREVKKSKVAICEKCGAFVMASHIDMITKDSEKEFTKLANMGFTVKLETIKETQARKYSFYEDCLNANCASF